MNRAFWCATLCMASWACEARADERTLVVVNDQSSASLEVGRYYAEKRDIPPAHIFHISVSNSFNTDTAAFSNLIRGPVLSYIATNGLSNQIDTLVFSKDIPYRIILPPDGNARWSGLTASMYYGFKSSPDPRTSGCELAAGSSNLYFGTEKAFRHGGSGAGAYYISAVLAASNLDVARRMIDRSVQADHAMPTSTVYLLHSTDVDRNVRWKGFEESATLIRLSGSPVSVSMPDLDHPAAASNVLGVMAGVKRVNNLGSLGFVPGAYSDHLTSYAGYLLDIATAPEPSQMSALDWNYHGGSGSYGPVWEPCNYTQKYPDPLLYHWYARGFSLGESHWMSVQNPYIGVFAGDPLCRPLARAPLVTVSGLTHGAVVTGVVALTVSATSTMPSGRVGRIDCFLDGRRTGTVAQAGLMAGNVLTAVVNSVTSSYVVAATDTIYNVAAGLAQVIQASTAGVTAVAVADRIGLTATNYGAVGTAMGCQVMAGPGSATQLQVSARAAFSNFLDTTYPARAFINLQGRAKGADSVTCTITLTNGTVVTNVVIAVDGESASNVLTRLAGVINSNLALQAGDGVMAKYLDGVTNVIEAALEARTPGPAGAGLHVAYSIADAMPPGGLLTADSFSDFFNDNGPVLRARNMIFLAAGGQPLVSALSVDTATLPDGPHELRLVAYEGDATETPGRAKIHFTVDNHGQDCEIVDPPFTRHYLQGYVVTVAVFSAGGAGAVTQLALHAEGKLLAVTNAGAASFTVDTARYGAGALALQGQAWGSAGEQTVSEARMLVIYTDNDADGVSDQWEYQHFGSATNHGALADPDVDGVGNVAEYLADTQPTNAASFFHLLDLQTHPVGTATLSFVSSTARFYRVDVNEGDLMQGALWLTPDEAFVQGESGVTSWGDPSTNTPASSRFYRVRALRP